MTPATRDICVHLGQGLTRGCTISADDLALIVNEIVGTLYSERGLKAAAWVSLASDPA